MRKQVLSLLALLAITFSLKAQTSGGPDAYGYTWRNNSDPNGPAYNWIDIVGQPNTVTVTSLTDDNVTAAINLPNPFHFYWYDVHNFRIGSNGYITFDANTNIASTGNGFPAIPTPGSTNNNYIAGQLSDLICNAGPGHVYYNISPTALIVTYDSVPFWDSTSAIGNHIGSNTFQIILDNTDSSIIVNYKDQQGASAATSGFASLGIENNSGTIGLQYLFDIYPTSGTSVKYYPPLNTTLAISDAATSYNDNPENGGIFISKNGGPFVLRTEVANVGNQMLNAFPVKSEIRSATNIIQVTTTSQTGPLNPGQSQLITQTGTFNPATAGTFFFRTDTQLGATDATPSNNRKDVEIDVIDTALATIELAYETATVSTAPNSWSGGDGGSAVYMKPSFAPYIINNVKEFIAQNTFNVGYSMLVYDDNGPGGAPGTLLDSVFVANGSFTLNTWKTTPLTNPIMKTGGGFYVLWYMGGNGIGIGTVTAAPISNRTYEVLTGTGPSNFAAYRDRETTEFMIRAQISKVVGVKELSKGELFGDIYPNPSTLGKVYMSYDLTAAGTSAFTVSVFNTNGQLVQQKAISSIKGTLDINVNNLNSGLYICKITNGSNEVERRFTVIK